MQSWLAYGVLIRWPIESACNCGKREYFSAANGCWSVRSPCVVGRKHVRCSYSLVGQVRWKWVYFGRCSVLVSAHTVRCKRGARTCSVWSSSVSSVVSWNEEVPSKHMPRKDDALISWQLELKKQNSQRQYVMRLWTYRAHASPILWWIGRPCAAWTQGRFSWT